MIYQLLSSRAMTGSLTSDSQCKSRRYLTKYFSIIIAIFLVMGYQIWSRKQKKDKDDLDKLEKLSKYKYNDSSYGKSGKGSKDLSALKQELDSLTKQSKTIEETLSQLPVGNRGKSSSSRANYADENDDYDNERIQEISYSKKNQ
mgnify:CR=1 FL=1|jgi:hypothetical protein